MTLRQNLISIIPLSFQSSIREIEKFFDQLVFIDEKIDVIVILEENDDQGYSNWKYVASKHKEFSIIIKKLKYQKSKGSCLNKAIDLCKTDYFMRCDMDDEIYPYRYKDTKQIIEKNEKEYIDLIYSDMFNLKNSKIIKYTTPTFLSLHSIWSNPIPAPTVCIRKAFLLKKKIRYPAFNRCEDLAINLQIIDNGAKCIKARRPLVAYSNHISLKRDYENWIKNAFLRFTRKRYDLVGILSLIMGGLIFCYGSVKYLNLKLVNNKVD